MNINMRIERLVLDGLPVAPHQGACIRAAVEAELLRLLREGGIRGELKSGGAFPCTPRGSIRLIPGSRPRAVGKQIAAAVYGRIGVNK